MAGKETTANRDEAEVFERLLRATGGAVGRDYLVSASNDSERYRTYEAKNAAYTELGLFTS